MSVFYFRNRVWSLLLQGFWNWFFILLLYLITEGYVYDYLNGVWFQDNKEIDLGKCQLEILVFIVQRIRVVMVNEVFLVVFRFFELFAGEVFGKQGLIIVLYVWLVYYIIRNIKLFDSLLLGSICLVGIDFCGNKVNEFG